MSPDRNLKLGARFSIPPEAVTQSFGILAKRGAGKTYCALVLVEEMLKAGLHVVVADPIGVAWGLRAAGDGKGPGLPIVIMGGEHGDVPLESTAGELVADVVVEEGLSVVLDLSLFRKGEQVRFMTDFAERLYHRNRAPLHLVLDEADAFAPQRPQKGQERMLGAIEDLVRRGRARGIGVTLITQRAAVLNKDVLTQIEVLVCLRTIAPQDRDAIDAWIRVHGTPAQREKLMASLPSLPIGTAWFWSPGWLDVFSQVEVRRRETFDSSATPEVGARVQSPKRLADVDLQGLRKRIAGTIERAKANDPKELRRRIHELERELASKPAAALPRIETREVHVLEEKLVLRVEKAILGHAREWLKALEASDRVQAVVKELQKTIAAAVGDQHAPAPPSRPVAATHPGAPLSTIREFRERHGRTRVGYRALSRNGEPSNGGDPLGAGERKMLGALALRHPTPLSREQLGTLSGYSSGGGTFRTYLPALRRRGLIEESSGGINLTAQGRVIAGDAPVSAPRTPREVQEMWKSALGAGERRMLDELIAAYPQWMSREELGRRSGYEASGGTFRTYLPKLRRNSLVEFRSDEVRASETLF